MFVDLSDTRSRIETLQEMLRYLSFAENKPMLRVSVSGNYDQPTEDAVRYYQQSRSLPVTGITDRRTWEMLADEYAYEKSRRQSVTIEPIPTNPDYVTGAAERSDTVLILQIMLRALAVRYDYPILPPLSGVYGNTTADAVRYFQEVNSLDPTGLADRETWRLMAEEYNSLVEQ